MIVAFTFTRVAVLVRRWFEIGPDTVMEHGARIELRLLEPQPHRGTESAAQRTVVDGVFWRADLFGRLDRPDAPWSAAHFHPRFHGVEPCDRVWSADLTADPWGWLATRLERFDELVRDAGVDPSAVTADAGDVRAFAGRIVATARSFGPDVPMTRDEDFALTRDAAHRVRLMLDLVPAGVPVDHDHLAPWLAAAP